MNQLDKIIIQAYETVCKSVGDDDPTEAWNKLLHEMGHVETIVIESHFGDGGVYDAIDRLVEKVNKPFPNFYIADDPTCEGTDFSALLVFNRTKYKHFLGTVLATGYLLQPQNSPRPISAEVTFSEAPK